MFSRYRVSLTFFFLVLGFTGAFASDSGQAGMTALIVDLKYSKEHGVQVCEVQTVSRSRFKGSDFAHDADGYVGEQLAPYFTGQFDRVWYKTRAITDPGLRRALEAEGAVAVECISELEERADFQACANSLVEDPASLASYHGLVYVRGSKNHSIESLREQYPGVIWVDADIWSHTESKGKMNELFREDAVLKAYKPRCRHFKRHYHQGIARDIQRSVSKGLVVIKPLNAVKGRGVLIVPVSDVDRVLRHILRKTARLRRDANPEYRFWYQCRDPYFVVEAFAVSDPVHVAHLNNRPYDGTMRAVAVVTQDDGQTHCELIDTYWKLPSRALNQRAGRTQRHKSCGTIPYFAEVDADIEAEVESQLAVALPRMVELLTQEDMTAAH